MNFSIEMETGTGKTYVYLRTVYELNSKKVSNLRNFAGLHPDIKGCGVVFSYCRRQRLPLTP